MAENYLHSCAACRYWSGWRNWTASGDCRKHAPQPNAIEGTASWPVTTSIHWCGDWTEAELTKEELERLGSMLVSRP